MRRTFRFALYLSGGVLASLCLLGAATAYGSDSGSGPVGVEVDKPVTGNNYPVLDSTPFAPDTETGIPSYDLTRPVVERDPRDRLWEILGLLAGVGAVGGAAGAVSYSRSRSAELPSRGEDRATAAVVDPIPVSSDEVDYIPSVRNAGLQEFDPAMDTGMPDKALGGTTSEPLSENDPAFDPSVLNVHAGQTCLDYPVDGTDHILRVWKNGDWEFKDRWGKVIASSAAYSGYGNSGVKMDAPSYYLLRGSKVVTGGAIDGAFMAALGPVIAGVSLPTIVMQGIPLTTGLVAGGITDALIPTTDIGNTPYQIRWVKEVSPTDETWGVADTRIVYGELRFTITESGILAGDPEETEVVFLVSHEVCELDGLCKPEEE